MIMIMIILWNGEVIPTNLVFYRLPDSQLLRFLKVAALESGQLLNFAEVSSDSGVSETTVRAYLEILKEARLIMVSFDATTRRWNEHFERWPVEEFLIALSEGEFDEPFSQQGSFQSLQQSASALRPLSCHGGPIATEKPSHSHYLT